ncbi:DUF6510 family protein [Kribbella sp. NPDC050124]|uniref:DUF6510 family protein n=1 Tax=Kribbella sp. NPDC050124 TaxID=3364114 RepID=UPI0037A7F306
MATAAYLIDVSITLTRELRRDRSVTRMGPLDGNAIAGVMHDLFVRDMTTTEYRCTGCRRTGVMAELVVYRSGPGTVARCRNCDTILLMLSERHGMYCVDLSGMPQTAHSRTTFSLKGA